MSRALWPLSYTGELAGAEGLEPSRAGIKSPCLTILATPLLTGSENLCIKLKRLPRPARQRPTCVVGQIATDKGVTDMSGRSPVAKRPGFFLFGAARGT